MELFTGTVLILATETMSPRRQSFDVAKIGLSPSPRRNVDQAQTKVNHESRRMTK